MNEIVAALKHLHLFLYFPTAFSLYQAAAEQGHPHAQQLVSIMHEKELADNSNKN